MADAGTYTLGPSALRGEHTLRKLLTVAALVLTLPGTTHTEQVPSARIRGAGADAVVVDVIVRDGRGNPVTGLTKADFQVFDDGVAQEIGDVTAVGAAKPEQSENVSASSPPPKSSASTSESQPPGAASSYMALVFDRLSPEARAASYKGALAVVEGMRPDDHVAVFLADLSLNHDPTVYKRPQESASRHQRGLDARHFRV